MRKLYIIGLIGLVGITASAALAEELTLTTYYPAPYGVYRQMRTTESLLLQAEPMNSNGPQLEWRTSGIGVERHWNIDQYQDPISTRLRFFTEDNAGDINPAIRLTILENGRVGIGTTNPGDKLQVIGSTRVGIDGTNYLQIGHGGANSYINAVGVGRLDFRHEGSNQMVLTDTGRLGIGTASPTQRLDVNGIIRMRNQTAADDADDIVATKGYVDKIGIRYALAQRAVSCPQGSDKFLTSVACPAGSKVIDCWLRIDGKDTPMWTTTSVGANNWNYFKISTAADVNTNSCALYYHCGGLWNGKVLGVKAVCLELP